MTVEKDKTAALPNVDETAQICAGRRILQALFGTIKAAMVYEANNRAYRSRAEELGRRLPEYIERYGSLRIDYFNDFFFIGRVRLRYGRADFSHDRELAVLFEELQLGRLEFLTVPDPELLDRMVFALAHIDRRQDDPYQALQTAWEKSSLGQIPIGRMAPKIADRLSTDFAALDTAQLSRRRAATLFLHATDLVRGFMQRAGDLRTSDTSKARRVVHDLIDHIVEDEATLLEFAAIKDFDDYTFSHSTNVCIYSIALGLRLGLDKSRLSQLGFAALFHDSGKVKLPSDLINKPEEYDEEDWRMIRKHPVLGALTLAAMPTTDEHNARGVLVAYEHHLALDGSGYPPTPTCREPNLFSRIVAIADSYDAMTSGRLYMKISISPDEALRRLLRQGGTRYDPILLRALAHVLGIFPAGTFVRLNTGELGIVSSNDPDDLYCPRVRILREASGEPAADRTVKLTSTDPRTGEYLAYITELVDGEDIDLTVREALGIPDPASAPAGE